MSLDEVRRIADAVLLEGYMLYPYRASAIKNRLRWSFGVLAPRPWSEAGGCEAWWMETQFLVEGPPTSLRIAGLLRFLRVQERRVEVEGGDGWQPVDSLETEDGLQVSFDEGETEELPFEVRAGEQVFPFHLQPSRTISPLAVGGPASRLRRERWGLEGRILSRSEALGPALSRCTVRVENLSPWEEAEADREVVMRRSCISTHLLFESGTASFLSAMDPPAWAAKEAAACRNVRSYPVLVGAEGRRDRLLAAPIILYDHPKIAPESPGDFFDATEIDELLALRTSTLTPAEKREMRAADPRAAALLDRVEKLTPADWEAMHGAIRDFAPAADPATASHPLASEVPAEQRGALALQGEEKVEADVSAQVPTWQTLARDEAALPRPDALPADLPPPGSRVRLWPGKRRSDAQDLLYAGCTATVEKVLQDVEGAYFLAVTIDEDPAAELHRWYGRFHYYYPDEVEALER